ncbi:spermatogenesis associated 6-like protein isoform X1 [Oryzias latipes]|uniref:spermatogenesis associated 6-like protein isoform X1 n=1 Tax=Oryzias latipes TaxID=8090 RepID=UPI0002A4900F|nr:spermatogenesis associated 6-like protein isoform X1 [Oryzias latipes]
MIPGLQRAFKVRVEIKFRAVSCPGVHLPAKEDVYLSVFVTGQYHQSECLPAVFPLLFQEKMTFEKIFRYAFDPGDVAVMLEHETVRVELVQLIPPAGHLLASFEENTRNFLFPEPKLVPPFSGLDREALMVRAPYFPGIAPRLEFSTKTSITQCLPDSETSIYPNVLMRPETHRKRCPSRRRRMASPEGKPPQTHRGRRAGSADPHSTARRQSLSPLRRRTGWKTNTSQPAGQIPQEDSGSLGRFGSAGTEYSPDPSALLWPNRKPPGSESRSHRVWEEVHERVRGLLTTPRAVRRLIYGASVSEVDEVLARRSVSPDLQ